MKKIPVWIDCDTGVDDSIALILAHAREEIEICGISCVAGNTTEENAYENTRRICALVQGSYPVYHGAKKPLLKEHEPATAFHGANGLGDVLLPLPEDLPERSEAAWDALYACAKRTPHLRLVATAPLTNLAIAFTKYPELPTLLDSVLIMGGSAGPGNVTLAAEFNIYTDPQAADIVLRSGAKIFLFGLDVTMQAYLTREDLSELAGTGKKAGIYVHDCLQRALESHELRGEDGVAMHDSCPVMYLVHPEYFEGEEAGVAVETRGTITLGKTVTDLYSDRQFPFRNAMVFLKVDRESFVQTLKEAILKAGEKK